jgi:hypothetical protein
LYQLLLVRVEVVVQMTSPVQAEVAHHKVQMEMTHHLIQRTSQKAVAVAVVMVGVDELVADPESLEAAEVVREKRITHQRGLLQP